VTVDVILPVLNEAEALPWVLGRFPDGYRPLVVDNGSTDGSGDVARSLGAEVVVETRPGFGAACFAGLIQAEAEVVAFMDADASFDPGELPAVVDAVVAGTADLSLGARRRGTSAWPRHSQLANWVLTAELRRRSGLRLRDLGPMRAARRTELLDLALKDRRFGWPLEMVLRAHEAGWRIAEVDITYLPRVGKSKVTGTVKGTARTIHDMAGLLR
jgi:glycosyltransferase involved in cell wall biosynthesis